MCKFLNANNDHLYDITSKNGSELFNAHRWKVADFFRQHHKFALLIDKFYLISFYLLLFVILHVTTSFLISLIPVALFLVHYLYNFTKYRQKGFTDCSSDKRRLHRFLCNTGIRICMQQKEQQFCSDKSLPAGSFFKLICTTINLAVYLLALAGCMRQILPSFCKSWAGAAYDLRISSNFRFQSIEWNYDSLDQ